MPHLNARAIEIDPEGMDYLRRVIATAAGGAIAYDPYDFVSDSDLRAVARPTSAGRLARGMFGQVRERRILSESNALVWA